MTTHEREHQTQCAWCRRYQTGDGWSEGNPQPELALTHGICPECFRAHEEGTMYDESGYDTADPKHPRYAEAAASTADHARKAARESGDLRRRCPQCGVTGQRATARSANGRELERHERAGTPCDACGGSGYESMSAARAISEIIQGQADDRRAERDGGQS